MATGMKVFIYMDTILRFHRLVLSENTGNAECFATKLNISRASLYRMIEDIQSYGIDVNYSRERNTYYYRYRDRVCINISIMQAEKKNKE